MLRFNAFFIEWRGANCTDHVRVFDDLDMRWKDLFSKRIEQEGLFAV